jgi:hypothetical protein
MKDVTAAVLAEKCYLTPAVLCLLLANRLCQSVLRSYSRRVRWQLQADRFERGESPHSWPTSPYQVGRVCALEKFRK